MDIYVVFANFFSFRPWSKRFLPLVESSTVGLFDNRNMATAT